MSIARSNAHSPAVSVVIPAWNEAESLGAALAALCYNETIAEVIVADADSSDGTARIAEEMGCRVVSSYRRQRAYQLNGGARLARADTLLFLHADTILSAGAIDEIIIALQSPRVIGGAFARRYASPSRLLRATCLLARLRNQTIGWHLGDQAMFVRRSAFLELGGFREVDQFEDLDFSRRLKRLGRIVTLTPAVTSSARRFQRGPARTTLGDLGLTIRYLIAGLPHPAPAPCMREHALP